MFGPFCTRINHCKIAVRKINQFFMLARIITVFHSALCLDNEKNNVII